MTNLSVHGSAVEPLDQVRWRERTRFRAGSAGPWRPWIALVALYHDPTRTRAEEVIPNPTRVYVTHFEPSPEV